MLTMPEPVSIFDIPLLLDTICAMLDPRDIGNCATCSKEWYSSFGPYRFQSVNIINMNVGYGGYIIGSHPIRDITIDAARNTFLLNNSHHIRDLTINLTHFDTFVDPNCNHLQNLTLGFAYEANEESDYDDDDPDDTGFDDPDAIDIDKIDPFDIPDPSVPKNKLACAAKLIQESPILRALHLSRAVFSSSYDSSWKHHLQARPLDKPILKAIGNHAFLTKIEVTLDMTCRMFGILLNHLPQQLQELDVPFLSQHVRNHRRCSRQSRQFQFRTSILGIRRLCLQSFPQCLSMRMFMHLLKRSPELEELGLPGSHDVQDTTAGIVQILDSNCKRLHTLNQNGLPLNIQQFSVLLKGFSKGFRQLCMPYVSSSDSAEWMNRHLLETLMTTVSFNTIEVLKYESSGDKDEHIIAILKNCPQLRVFRVERYYREMGVDLSDVLLSMDGSWMCWGTLEELQLKIANKKAVQEHSGTEARRQRTAQDVRELCLRLRSFPKLKTLDIRWRLKNTWDPESYDEESYYQESYDKSHEITLTLDDLNEGALKSGSATMTKEDGAWAGLKLD
ncbi:MAG: hypothetical protein J3Q66DRAFT_325894 [Benniella sp.]|nr:MAG: hypothetical protein J3Q66DRAFT_325894 [Benniella sp.]